MIQAGYFQSAQERVPTYDPGIEIDCPICHTPLKDEKISTISLMREDDDRSYFYRLHTQCKNALTEAEAIALDSEIIDAPRGNWN